MSKYTYSEIKLALGAWKQEKNDWADNESQKVNGIRVGYFQPSQANWSYQMHVEVLTDNEGEQYLCETIRVFGVLAGVITTQYLKYLLPKGVAK